MIFSHYSSLVEQGKESQTADCTKIEEAAKDPETTDFNHESDNDDDSYKRELMDQLDKKVEEKSKPNIETSTVCTVHVPNQQTPRLN